MQRPRDGDCEPSPVPDRRSHEPLLDAESRSSFTDSQSPDSPMAETLRVPLACILLNFLIEMFDQIIIVPQLALFEQAICRAYYTSHDSSLLIGQHGSVGGDQCKIDPVQQQLAVLRSWKAFWDALPGHTKQSNSFRVLTKPSVYHGITSRCIGRPLRT